MFLRAAIIVVLGFISYGCMLSTPFRVMDDQISIVNNPMIRSVKNIPTIFKEGYFHDQSFYRPMVNISFMGEYHFFGLNSVFYNLDNLILHILNALLVLLLVSRLTGNNTIGFWVALLFVMHPVQWEAVCNVPGRSILLSAFFVLSSFLLFLKFYKERRWYWGVLVLITFFLGLLCKESTGVLPLVILTYLALAKTDTWPQKLESVWPFFIGILGYVFLRQYFGMTNVHHVEEPLSLILGFVTFLRSVITDLRLFILPIDLHYDRSLPLVMSLQEPRAWEACLFWAVACVALVFYYKKINPFILFLIFWFCIELLPVSQLVAGVGVGGGHISTAEHFLYVACIPVFIGMVMAFRWIYETKKIKEIIWKFLAGGFLAFLLLTTVEQSIYASNEFIMISRSLNYEPNNSRVQSAMAMLSVYRGDIPDAEKHFRAAIKEEPLNARYHIGLGTALCQQGKWIECLEQLVVYDPGKDKDLVERQEKITMPRILQQIADGKTFDDRGWLAIGVYYAKTGSNPEAINAFLKTISVNPRQPDAWFDLGSLYEAQKNWPEARAAYKRLLDLREKSKFQMEFASQHLTEIENR